METCKSVDKTEKQLLHDGIAKEKREKNSQEMNHKCDICEMKFQTSQDLKRHKVAIHCEENPVQCKDCEKTFTSSANLKVHMRRIHKKMKPIIECDLCGKTFTTLEKMTEHVRDIHNSSNNKGYQCDICE